MQLLFALFFTWHFCDFQIHISFASGFVFGCFSFVSSLLLYPLSLLPRCPHVHLFLDNSFSCSFFFMSHGIRMKIHQHFRSPHYYNRKSERKKKTVALYAIITYNFLSASAFLLFHNNIPQLLENVVVLAVIRFTYPLTIYTDYSIHYCTVCNE